MECWAVPGGYSTLNIPVGCAEYIVALTHGVIERRVAVRTARLDARNGVGNRVDVKRGRRCWLDRRGECVALPGARGWSKRPARTRELQSGSRGRSLHRASLFCSRLRLVDALRDGLRQVVNRHRVAGAAVVARDHIEIFEPDSIGRPVLLLGCNEYRRGVAGNGQVDFHAMRVQGVDGLVQIDFARIDLERRVGLEVRLGNDRAAAFPAVFLQVVGNARNDVIPVAPQVALVVGIGVDSVAAVAWTA